MSASLTPSPTPSPHSIRHIAWLLCLFLGVGFLYTWTAAPDFGAFVNKGKDFSYYNLLADGMAKGHLWLDIPDDPFLQNLADPYKVANRQGHGLHDATYYKGKTYIYFGVTPAVTVYLPFRLLTGWAVTDRTVVLGYAWLGWVFSFLLVWFIQRRYYPGTPFWLVLAIAAVLGIATLILPVLRRPTMYEVVISGGYVHFMAALYFITRSVHAEKRSGLWLALASLAMGLAVGCRPIYLPASFVLLLPCFLVRDEANRLAWRTPAFRRTCNAALVPIALVGVGLAAYNYLRFDSPFQFGQKYQMSGGDEINSVLFSLSYIPFNAYIYLLCPPGLSPYFPFLTVVSPPVPPPGHLGLENPYGIVSIMPWVLLALFAFGPLGNVAPRLRALAGTFAAAGTALMLIVFCFAGNTGRYQVDFSPTWMLVASLGALALYHAVARSRWRPWVAAGLLLLGGFSCLTNLLLGVQYNRLFAREYPSQYSALARAANTLPALIEQQLDVQHGPVRLVVDFPTDAVGQVEPLVVTGHQFLADYLYVHYLGPAQIRFGFTHTSEGNWTSEPITLSTPGPHTVEIAMGSLYPPADHPFFAPYRADEKRQMTHQVSVHLDGKLVFFLPTTTYDSTQWNPSIGVSGPHRPGFPRAFSGHIHQVARLKPAAPKAHTGAPLGPLVLSLRFPNFVAPLSEPLLCSGKTGAGDLIYITYVDAQHVRFGHDHWGYGGTVSDPIKIPDDRQALLELDCPPLHNASGMGRLSLKLNGQTVFAQDAAFHPTHPDEVAVGSNLIGASTSTAHFTGRLDALRSSSP